MVTMVFICDDVPNAGCSYLFKDIFAWLLFFFPALVMITFIHNYIKVRLNSHSVSARFGALLTQTITLYSQAQQKSIREHTTWMGYNSRRAFFVR